MNADGIVHEIKKLINKINAKHKNPVKHDNKKHENILNCIYYGTLHIVDAKQVPILGLQSLK